MRSAFVQTLGTVTVTRSEVAVQVVAVTTREVYHTVVYLLLRLPFERERASFRTLFTIDGHCYINS